ncbi:MAG: alpha-amylase, partial [Treponemataceae bacterium]
GTGLPWNDTAQIDFLNAEAREEVIQKILHVARNFPIIRFDAAMVLAKKHIRRLWYPHPGCGGDIATRSEYSMMPEDFEKAIPLEFWREVVDRCAKEIPDTLLLAEAFWMMEGYFVRTLGMHRVYNSAFMNMLKKEENDKYRQTIKNTLEFDPQVLRRFVNFMNNPDEETAVAQFGDSDKYFGVCTLMVTMPGLPMFGHGQIEGFTEKYGMEYQRSYYDEQDNLGLIARHEKDIFPLMKKRYLFAHVENFYLYDLWNNDSINENVFAYSNQADAEHSIVLYNNKFDQACGWIKETCPFGVKNNDTIQLEKKTLAQALQLTNTSDHYCIFQEQRSGLWFIRSNEVLFNEGLYVFLNGFESQILLNFYEVTDDKTQKFALLHNHLQGSGVKNIEIALQELLFGDLYKAFTNFINADLFYQIELSCMDSSKRKKHKLKIPAITKTLLQMEDNAKKYFHVLDECLSQNDFVQSILKKSKNSKKMTSDQVWQKLKKRILALNSIRKFAETPPKSFSNDLMSFYTHSYKIILDNPLFPSLLCGYTILYTLKDLFASRATANDITAIIYSLGLNRKMSEMIFEAENLLAEKNKRTAFFSYDEVVSLVKTSIEIINNPATKKDTCNDYIFSILSNLNNSQNAGMIIGKNTFENITWFNAQKMKTVESLLYLVQLLFSNPKKDFPMILETNKKLALGVKKSEYKMEKLLEYFSPSTTTKKKRQKKNTKKTTDK